MNTPPISAKYNTIFVDVMMDDRFLFTMKYKWLACFKFDIKDVKRKVLERRPSLEGKPLRLFLN